MESAEAGRTIRAADTTAESAVSIERCALDEGFAEVRYSVVGWGDSAADYHVAIEVWGEDPTSTLTVYGVVPAVRPGEMVAGSAPSFDPVGGDGPPTCSLSTVERVPRSGGRLLSGTVDRCSPEGEPPTAVVSVSNDTTVSGYFDVVVAFVDAEGNRIASGFGSSGEVQPGANETVDVAPLEPSVGMKSAACDLVAVDFR